MYQPAVHISEVKSFLRCRLAWYWSAPRPRGLNLEPKVSKAALNFGRLVHQALQIGYDTGELFADAFKTLAEDNLKALVEAGPVFESEIEEIKKQQTLGIAMLQGYQGWARGADQHLKFLALETKWEGVRFGRVPAAGRFDSIVEREDGVWVMDFKTTKFSSTDWTAQDLQATAYVHAARKLYGKNVRGLLFRFLLKKAPQTYDKLILKNGSVTSRSTLPSQTTFEEYTKALAVATLKELVENDFTFAGETGLNPSSSLQDYAYVLDENLHEQSWYPEFREAYTKVRQLFHSTTQQLKGHNPFFWEVAEFRTNEQVDRYLRTLLIPVAKEMVSRRKGRWMGPTGLGTAFASCRTCQFKAACKLAMDGADFRSYLLENYRQRRRDY